MKKATLTDDGRAAVLDTDTGELTVVAQPYTTVIAAHFAPVFKTPHNHDRDAESNAHSTSFMEPSKTQQQFAKDADINVILAKFMHTGELPMGAQRPNYMDIDQEFDLQNQMVTAFQVQEAWEALPTAVRATLTPATFCDYVDHCVEKGDLAPLVELGLVDPPNTPVAAPEAPKPAVTPGASPAPAAGNAAPAA